MSKVSESFPCISFTLCPCVQYKKGDDLLILLLGSTQFCFIISINPCLPPLPSSIICPLTPFYIPPAIPLLHGILTISGNSWRLMMYLEEGEEEVWKAWPVSSPPRTHSVTKTLKLKYWSFRPIFKSLANSLIDCFDLFIHSIRLFFRQSPRPSTKQFLYRSIHPSTHAPNQSLILPPIYILVLPLPGPPTRQPSVTNTTIVPTLRGHSKGHTSNRAHISLYQAAAGQTACSRWFVRQPVGLMPRCTDSQALLPQADGNIM